MSEGHRITDPHHARTFVFAGKSIFTLKSLKSGNHLTYKVRKPKRVGPGPLFVSVLDHANGNGDYTYLGIISNDRFDVTRKSAYYRQPDAIQVRAFGWFFSLLTTGTLSDKFELWHEGKCGRCGRRLTHPESIATGIGPECADKMGV